MFAYNVFMFPTPSGRKTFVVTCKRCRRDVPSGRDEFPFQSITVECPQNEIETALESMDAFVALLTENFHESLWTDQEVGYSTCFACACANAIFASTSAFL
jgi:hypothetical protein